MYDTVIFDLDGTLLNTLDDLCDSTNYALKTHGMPARTIEEVRQFVGNGIRKLIERAVPQGTEPEELEKVYDDLRNIMMRIAMIRPVRTTESWNFCANLRNAVISLE